MISLFHKQWDEVPLCVHDVETTGVGLDAHVVSYGCARFEGGVYVGGLHALVHCPVPIPPEATAIHGIRDGIGRPPLREVLLEAHKWSDGAQSAAYNAPFDRRFLTADSYPWLDGLVIVRHVDRWVSGVGRHKLTVTCARYDIELVDAHSAGADARAAGELIYKLGRTLFPKQYIMGRLLDWCARADAKQQHEYRTWRANIWRFRNKAKEWYGRPQ